MDGNDQRMECVGTGQLVLCLHWVGTLIRGIQVHRPGEVSMSENPSEHARLLAEALARYEAGGPPDWPDLPLDFSGLSEFQRAALDELLQIAPGTTRTYGELAALLGRPKGAQAVGRAMAANPFPVIYPCHRVVGANGAMTGFSAGGGIGTKKLLLRLEGAIQGELPLLAD